MKKNYLFSLICLLAGLFMSTHALAQVDWEGTYTVVAQYEDAQNGNAVKDDTFEMTIGKDGNDILVKTFCGYTEVLYGGLLTKANGSKLNVYCDNIVMISTEEERYEGIIRYVALRDVDGGKSDIVLEKAADGTFKLSPFSLVEYQRGSTEYKTLRRYVTIKSVKTGESGGDVVETKWEMMKSLISCSGFHIDEKTGTFLASDFRDDLQGGIYYSDDKGQTWTKTKVADHNYIKFYQTDEYVFALGYGGRVARSDDGGHSWELLSYRRAISDIVSQEDMDYTAAYDMVQVGKRIYVADYAGGVIYSEDYGETWTHTSDDIFLEETEGKNGKETIHNVLYGIAEHNGHILAMGLYYVYEYDAKNDSWKIVRDDSNLMAIHCEHKGKLYCGRSMPNDGYRNVFLEVTEDGVNWGPSGRPDSEDNNVRALASNGYLMVAGLQSTGILYTDDDTETWYELETDGLPLRFPGNSSLTDQKLTPMSITFDSDYIYVAFFSDNPSTQAGVWRYPLADLVPTAIDVVKNDSKSSKTNLVYDLQGRKVGFANKGIYIKDGKKIVR